MPNLNTNISELLKDMNTYSRNIIKNMAARHRHLLRMVMILLLLLAGGGMSGVWGADYLYTYYVVNKDGVVSVWHAETQTAGEAPHIPTYIKSPFLPNATQYHY